ncbi:MAG: CheC, inhibitor of methylation [Gemmatimonadetes bacterium]|nr:CheC, inhibitor of methylation [Gemmatimonadota bacterium]
MILGDFETDALTELFNVGLHRAAASLSEITGQRILVDMPQLVICPLEEIEPRLAKLIGGEIATVHQVFGGAVTGDAVLLLEQDKAAALAMLMTDGEAALGGRLDQSAREVLTEVGNIVLGACLSGFGDMLQTPVTFSVPRIHIDMLRSILSSLLVETGEVQYAVIVATQFRLSELAVDGYLIVAVGPTSLTRITEALAHRMG